METLLENKTINTLKNEASREPAPFYTNEKMSFYKNRLIAIEEIISIEESSGHNENTKKHFDIFDSSISYNLTFEDEQGNTHTQKSTKKPRQIGDMFYYVINNHKLTHIAHETDKESLKQFISLDKGQYGDYTGKKFKIANFLNKQKNLFVLFILTLLIMDLILGAYFFIHNKTSIPYLVIFSLGGVLPLLLITLVTDTWDKCDKEIAKIISDKKENIFKSFI